MVLRGEPGDLVNEEGKADKVREKKSVVALLLWHSRSSCLYWPETSQSEQSAHLLDPFT